jgi:hypothetical protein
MLAPSCSGEGLLGHFNMEDIMAGGDVERQQARCWGRDSRSLLQQPALQGTELLTPKTRFILLRGKPCPQ